MAAIAIALVILSGLVHAIWNLFAKKSINKYAFLWFCQLASILIFLPFALAELHVMESVPFYGWLLLAASMVLHGAYMILLAKTYTMGDLSQVYPIMRGISPLAVPLIGVLILREYVAFWGWIGIASIVAGIFLIGDFKGSARLKLDYSVLFAVLVGVMITSYTVVDKLALEHFPVFILNEATNIGNMAALTFMALKSRALLPRFLLRRALFYWRSSTAPMCRVILAAAPHPHSPAPATKPRFAAARLPHISTKKIPAATGISIGFILLKQRLILAVAFLGQLRARHETD